MISTDVVEIFLDRHFEGRHEEYDEDCYRKKKKLMDRITKLIKALRSKKIKLNDMELFNLTKMFHCKGKGIQVVTIVKECCNNKSDFWRFDWRRRKEEKLERNTVSGTQKQASTHQDELC